MATPQFITDNSGKKLAVVLPMKEYNRMLEDLEDLEDVKAYDKAMNGKKKFMSKDKVKKK